MKKSVKIAEAALICLLLTVLIITVCSGCGKTDTSETIIDPGLVTASPTESPEVGAVDTPAPAEKSGHTPLPTVTPMQTAAPTTTELPFTPIPQVTRFPAVTPLPKVTDSALPIRIPIPTPTPDAGIPETPPPRYTE